MEKRLILGRRLEVSRLLEEVDVRRQSGLGEDRFSDLLEVGRDHPEIAGDGHRDDDDEERREQSTNPANPEIGETESVLFDFSDDDRADQESGDDEEDIDSCVSSGKT